MEWNYCTRLSDMIKSFSSKLMKEKNVMDNPKRKNSDSKGSIVLHKNLTPDQIWAIMTTGRREDKTQCKCILCRSYLPLTGTWQVCFSCTLAEVITVKSDCIHSKLLWFDSSHPCPKKKIIIIKNKNNYCILEKKNPQ